MMSGSPMSLAPHLNHGHVYRSRVDPHEAGRTLLDYNVQRFEKSDEAAWRERIEAGMVRVNDLVAGCAARLATGDRVEYHRPPWLEPPAPAHFGVVHEDEHVLVVAKPAGLQVQPGGPFLERTLWHLVRQSAPQRADSAPVHRLGRGSSGLVLFGLHSAARAHLSLQFRACTPRKTYLAWVDGRPHAGSYVARQPIGPLAHGALTIFVASATGLDSITLVRALRFDAARERTLVAAQPVTGRPDQIRVHLAANGTPITGDPLFGPDGRPKSDVAPGAGGYHLHATSLRIAHPRDGRAVKFRAPPPWSLTDAPGS